MEVTVNKKVTTTKIIEMDSEDIEVMLQAKLELTGDVRFTWNRGQCVSLTITETFSEDKDISNDKA